MVLKIEENGQTFNWIHQEKKVQINKIRNERRKIIKDTTKAKDHRRLCANECTTFRNG